MITVLLDPSASDLLKRIARHALLGRQVTWIQELENLPDLRNQTLLFCGQLNSCGVSPFLLAVLEALQQRGIPAAESGEATPLAGCVAGLILHSESEYYTKSAGAHLIFLANRLGCRFVGHPLVEATGSLNNFRTWQKTMSLSLEEIAMALTEQLIHRLEAGFPAPLPLDGPEKPKLVYLHSSFRETSNTLTLWHLVADHLSGLEVEELYVENGAVFDCFGCSFKACYEYGKQKSCYYGGVMTEKIIPAIEAAQILVWICPNYNDALSSNLTAVINRLTTLYRQIKFYDKRIYGIVVSGNSGSDAIARQLINALNINKGFALPDRFALMETANDRGAILKVPQIEEKAAGFARRILQS